MCAVLHRGVESDQRVVGDNTKPPIFAPALTVACGMTMVHCPMTVPFATEVSGLISLGVIKPAFVTFSASSLRRSCNKTQRVFFSVIQNVLNPTDVAVAGDVVVRKRSFLKDPEPIRNLVDNVAVTASAEDQQIYLLSRRNDRDWRFVNEIRNVQVRFCKVTVLYPQDENGQPRKVRHCFEVNFIFKAMWEKSRPKNFRSISARIAVNRQGFLP